VIDGHWLSVRRDDPRAFAFYRRHYSSLKNMRPWRARVTNFLGPGECVVLLSSCGRAVFAWQHNTIKRWDGQAGVCCTLFRNEGAGLSSELIHEADEIAWRRWPGERHFTYVRDASVRSTNPGYCFLKAGWHRCGRNADGRLSVLEVLP